MKGTPCMVRPLCVAAGLDSVYFEWLRWETAYKWRNRLNFWWVSKMSP